MWIGSTRAICQVILATDTIFIRYNCWSKNLRWESIFTAISQDTDFEYLIVDVSIAQIHQHDLQKTAQQAETVGKSQGGLRTKIHALI